MNPIFEISKQLIGKQTNVSLLHMRFVTDTKYNHYFKKCNYREVILFLNK